MAPLLVTLWVVAHACLLYIWLGESLPAAGCQPVPDTQSAHRTGLQVAVSSLTNAADLSLKHCSTCLTHACCALPRSLHWTLVPVVAPDVTSILTCGCWAQAAFGSPAPSV